jgi:hypothetical protein
MVNIQIPTNRKYNKKIAENETDWVFAEEKFEIAVKNH